MLGPRRLKHGMEVLISIDVLQYYKEERNSSIVLNACILCGLCQAFVTGQTAAAHSGSC